MNDHAKLPNNKKTADFHQTVAGVLIFLKLILVALALCDNHFDFDKRAHPN